MIGGTLNKISQTESKSPRTSAEPLPTLVLFAQPTSSAPEFSPNSMGSCRFAALIVLLLAFALLPDPAASARVLQGEKPSSSSSSSSGASAPTAAAGGSAKSGISKELGQTSTAVQNPDTNKHHQETPQPATAPKDSPPPPSGEAENKGQEGGAVQVSAQPVPPKNAHKDTPLGAPGLTGETDQEGGGSSMKPTDERKEVEKCVDPVDKCLIKGEFSACLQVSQNASIGSFVIVLNEGQNDIIVNVKATPSIDIDEMPQHLHAKGIPAKVNIRYSNPNGGEITLNVGNEHCVLRIRQPVSDWRQQFQQFAAYATRMNPIYGAYFFVFTIVLVGFVCACCKFARRRRDVGVPYQQLEMGAQAPNSSGADNTTSTVDGWEDGWDDDWDDEAAPAKPSDKKPAGNVSANGLSLRSQTNSKDGWDVDWDD